MGEVETHDVLSIFEGRDIHTGPSIALGWEPRNCHFWRLRAGETVL